MLDAPTKIFPGWSNLDAQRTAAEWRRRIGLQPPERYRPGAVIYAPSRPTSDLFVLTDGVVGLCTAVAKRETLFMLAYPGLVLNIDAADAGALRGRSAVSLTHCLVHRVSIRTIRELRKRDFELAALLERSLQTQLDCRTATLLECLILSPAERFRHELVRLAKATGQRFGDRPTTKLRVPLTDVQIAMLLGVSVRHIRRLKAELEKNGWARFEGPDAIILQDEVAIR